MDFCINFLKYWLKILCILIAEIFGALLNFAPKTNASLALPYPGPGMEVIHELAYKWRICHSREGVRCGRLSILYNLKISMGFPGGAVVESLPAGAGDAGSSPGLGRSHMPRTSWAREPQLLSLCVWSLCSATREAAMMGGPRTAMRSGPHLPQLEKALAQKQGPNTAKINK